MNNFNKARDDTLLKTPLIWEVQVINSQYSSSTVDCRFQESNIVLINCIVLVAQRYRFRLLSRRWRVRSSEESPNFFSNVFYRFVPNNCSVNCLWCRHERKKLKSMLSANKILNANNNNTYHWTRTSISDLKLFIIPSFKPFILMLHI